MIILKIPTRSTWSKLLCQPVNTAMRAMHLLSFWAFCACTQIQSLAETLGVFDVVVAGAGPAGLSTVRHLLQANLSILLLDRSERVGGRSRTLKFGKYGVDVGPAWVHYGTANPLTYLAEQGNCSMVRTQNLNMNVYHAGKVVPRPVVSDMFRLLDDIEAGYNRWKSFGVKDDSLLHVFQQIFRHKALKLSSEQEAAFAAILYGEIIEDWTAPLHELSAVRHCEYDSVDGVGSDWRIVEGMECIIQQIIQPNSQSFSANRHVKRIRIGSDLIDIEGDGWDVSSQVAVVALPLGELREGMVSVEPLPDWKQRCFSETFFHTRSL